MKLLAFLVFIIIATSFKPNGVVTTVLTCKSKSGLTKFSTNLTDYDIFGHAELILDGGKLNFSSKDKGHIINDSRNKVFTMYLESSERKIKGRNAFLRFWAIPSTFQSSQIDKTSDPYSLHEIYKFKAKLISSDPREGKESETSTIELECTLENTL